MTTGINERIEDLIRRLRSLESAVVAFSGGVDSTLLLECAFRALGDRVVALTAESPSFTIRELSQARKFCEERGIEHGIVRTREMEVKGYTTNPEDRCYYCKRELIARFLEVADGKGITHLVEGTNASELTGHRPGHRATEECDRVVTPLVDAGFTKEDVRAASKALGLPTWNSPSAACLASRVPTGVEITEGLLSRIGAAEQRIRDCGVRQVRVRHHGDVARIEVGSDEIGIVIERRCEIEMALKDIGWRFVSVDLSGYRTGSLSGGTERNG